MTRSINFIKLARLMLMLALFAAGLALVLMGHTHATAQGEKARMSAGSPMRAERTTQAALPFAAALKAEHVEGQLLVKFAPGAQSEGLARRAHARIGANVVKRFPLTGWQHVRLPAGLSLSAALSLYQGMPGVLAVQPDYIYHAAAVPNDPLYSNQYGLQKIAAPAAWDLNTGSSEVVVAVIDTGIYYPHEDLSANMWRNPGETGTDSNGNDKATNGVDDDGDGYADDVYGIDAFNHDSNPIDDRGHGTHCAGIIGAAGDNAKGVAGVNWNVRLMALKFISQAGEGTTDGAIECFNYVTMMRARGVNVRVTNNSYGGTEVDFALRDAMDAAGDAGVLNVCAAGNAATDIDANPFYPASFDSTSIISVAASDQDDNRAYFTNYGAASVDLAAPGVSILSTVSDGPMYDYLSGTSMSAPYVSGAAALLLARHASLSGPSLKATLMNTADALPQWSGKVASGGRLNVSRALQSPTVCAFSLSSGARSFTLAGGSGSVDLSAAGGCEWTARSNADWLTITAGNRGSGSGSVGYAVAANTSGAPRTATLSVAGQSFTVTQFADGLSIGGRILDESGAGLAGVTVQVRGQQLSLLETAQTDERGRYQFDGLPQGYDYSVEPARDGYAFAPASRSITSLGSDQTADFTATPLQCSFTLSSTSQHFTSTSGSGFFFLTTTQGCYWRVRTSVDWLNTFSSDGYDDTTLSYYVDANPTHAARSGEIDIGGQVFTVTQDAAPDSCQYLLTPLEASFGPEGGRGEVAVQVSAGCEWRARSNDFWINLTPSGGSGSGTVTYAVGGNGGPSKTGTMTIAGQTVTIHQQGAAGIADRFDSLSGQGLTEGAAILSLRQYRNLFWTGNRDGAL